jgi:DNA-binding SARP family transcriptional activator
MVPGVKCLVAVRRMGDRWRADVTISGERQVVVVGSESLISDVARFAPARAAGVRTSGKLLRELSSYVASRVRTVVLDEDRDDASSLWKF